MRVGACAAGRGVSVGQASQRSRQVLMRDVRVEVVLDRAPYPTPIRTCMYIIEATALTCSLA